MISQILSQAANIIEQNGWVQGWLGKNKGPCCVVGAIIQASGGKITGKQSFNSSSDPERWKDSIRWLRDHLMLFSELQFQGSLSEWNDSRKRSAEEVIFVLRTCAEVAEFCEL